MASFSLTAIATDALPSSSMVSDNHVAQYQPDSIHPVSAVDGGSVGPFSHECPSECRADGTKVPPQAEVEAELDHAISQLADAAVAAEAQGDRTGARIYVRRMYAAIQSRTPEHQARLNAQSLARLNDGAAYFLYQGELARQRIEQERAE